MHPKLIKPLADMRTVTEEMKAAGIERAPAMIKKAGSYATAAKVALEEKGASPEDRAEFKRAIGEMRTAYDRLLALVKPFLKKEPE